MCGIFGYIGKKVNTSVLVDGLKKLEYRGYDSYGLGYLRNDGTFEVFKDVGAISTKKLSFNDETELGIGHTRWATHGKVSIINSHPHYSCDKRFLIVHNGIINNAKNLRSKYLEDIEAISETDTEIIADLLALFCLDMSVLGAIKRLFRNLEGSYALLIIDTFSKDRVYFCKKTSPLLLGECSEGFYFSSDKLALASKNALVFLDYSYGYVTKDKLVVLSSKYDKAYFEVNNENTYEIRETNSNMLYEILEESNLADRIKKFYSSYDLNKTREKVKTCRRVIFIGCGSSFYAGKYLSYITKSSLKKETLTYLASEFVYEKPILRKNDLVVLISQSGETLDMCKILSEIKTINTILVTNNPNSTLGYLVSDILPMACGTELAVAATKSFLSTIFVWNYVINDEIAYKLNLSDLVYEIENLASRIIKFDKIFILGRGIDYVIAEEIALKLREIAYFNCYAFPSGELKHGSIALVDKNTLVIGLASSVETFDLVKSNVEEATSRGAEKLYLLSNKIPCNSGLRLDFSNSLDNLNFIVIGQLLAYYAGVLLGNDVDKPRNLAKSVTVE